jgi:hypothetical protein
MAILKVLEIIRELRGEVPEEVRVEFWKAAIEILKLVVKKEISGVG